MKIFNTLTRQLAEFVPQEPGKVRMYTCGPTVYDHVHVGNLRYFVFVDLLRRVFARRGYGLHHVMNLTDVEDKIIAGMQRTGQDLSSFTQPYIDAFFVALDTLRIERPEVCPRATEHIDEIIALVARLRDAGHTYEKDGSVYYRIHSFAEYGKLSGFNLDEVQSGARVDRDEYDKDDARDFVLWKAKKEGEPFWDSPVGPGRPGWHIECSAMAMRYLGESFDIHCGGEDLIFPHHENEIAQSEGATGRPFAKYWLHLRHLLVDGQKMSKSLGNFFTLNDLIAKGHHPLAIRLFLLRAHYRAPLNLSEEGLRADAEARERIVGCYRRLAEMSAEGPAGEAGQEATRAREAFDAALDDDLNTPNAVAACFELVRQANQRMAEGSLTKEGAAAAQAAFEDMDSVLGILPEAAAGADAGIDGRVEERQAARKARDFATADRIRDELAAEGIVLEDTQEGVRWYRRD